MMYKMDNEFLPEQFDKYSLETQYIFKRQKSFKINFLFLFSLQWFVIKLFKLSGNFAIVPQFRDDLFIFISVGIDCEPFNKCI